MAAMLILFPKIIFHCNYNHVYIFMCKINLFMKSSRRRCRSKDRYIFLLFCKLNFVFSWAQFLFLFSSNFLAGSNKLFLYTCKFIFTWRLLIIINIAVYCWNKMLKAVCIMCTYFDSRMLIAGRTIAYFDVMFILWKMQCK